MEVRTVGTRRSHGLATDATYPCPIGRTSARRGTAASSQEAVPSRDRARAWCQSNLGDALEAGHRAPGDARPAPPPARWAAVAPHLEPVAPGVPPAPSGRPGRGIRDRALDAASDRDGHRARVWRALPSSLPRPCSPGSRVDTPAADP